MKKEDKNLFLRLTILSNLTRILIDPKRLSSILIFFNLNNLKTFKRVYNSKDLLTSLSK